MFSKINKLMETGANFLMFSGLAVLFISCIYYYVKKTRRKEMNVKEFYKADLVN